MSGIPQVPFHDARGAARGGGSLDHGPRTGEAGGPHGTSPPPIVVTRTGSSAYADPLTDGIGFCGYTHYVAVNDLGTIAGNSGNGCQNIHDAWLTDGSAFTSLAYPGAAKTGVSGLNDWGTVVGT